MGTLSRILPVVAILLSGCVGPVALKQAVPDYDETLSQLHGKSLLLNVARARHKVPPHFTTATSIAATFNYEVSAGILGNFPSDSAAGLPNAALRLGAIVAENPTIELIPLQGPEYERRILTPLDHGQFRVLINRRVSFDMIMRLLGKAFHFQNRDGSVVRSVRNRPDIPDEYEEYRRIALHLASLYAKNLLFFDRLSFTDVEHVTLSSPPSPSDRMAASQSGFRFTAVDGKGKYEISKRVIGNTLAANYDPASRSVAELAELDDVISATPRNYVQVDIRPQYPGADYRLFGAIELRSLNGILDFIADGIEESPEYDVEADPRTAQLPGSAPKSGDWQRNPARTLTILESDTPPEDGVLSVRYRGSYYFVRQDPWDLDVFQSLSVLFLMSAPTPGPRAFPITINK